MNLKLGKGKVPIYTDNGYIFVDYPTMEDFCQLYNNYTRMDTRVKYWQILSERVNGKTLSDSGKLYGYSRERVRQIEAKFLKLMMLKHYDSLEPNA